MLGKLQKPSENIQMYSNGKFSKNFYNILILHLWTEDHIQEFWFLICTGVMLFALV